MPQLTDQLITCPTGFTLVLTISEDAIITTITTIDIILVKTVALITMKFKITFTTISITNNNNHTINISDTIWRLKKQIHLIVYSLLLLKYYLSRKMSCFVISIITAVYVIIINKITEREVQMEKYHCERLSYHF